MDSTFLVLLCLVIAALILFWWADSDCGTSQPFKFHNIRSPFDIRSRRGRGIVIAAGGKYTEFAVRNIENLRRLGCKLPIIIVHADEKELPPFQSPLGQRLSKLEHVTFINATHAFGESNPHLSPINFRGFQIKAFAVLLAPFREVMLLDADTLHFRDPTYLFNTADFRRTGSLFWPDVVSPDATQWLNPKFWSWIGVNREPKDELQQESSCVMLDWDQHEQSIMHTCNLNYQYKETYTLVHGDKDTWRAGCLLAKRPYAFIHIAPGALIPRRGYVKNFVQYDQNGNCLYAQGEGLRCHLFELDIVHWVRKAHVSSSGALEQGACILKPVPPEIVNALTQAT